MGGIVKELVYHAAIRARIVARSRACAGMFSGGLPSARAAERDKSHGLVEL
jgi:hypothetical protein